MKSIFSRFKAALRKEWNAFVYALWRWWKNMTVAKAIYITSPIWVTIIIFAVFLLPTSRGECGSMVGSMRYQVVGTTLRIEGKGAMDGFVFGDIATVEPPWWAWKHFIRKIEISDGVTSIGRHAFEKFGSLRSIEIPDSVWLIEREAFRDCVRLEEIRAEGAHTILDDAFYGCSSLREAVFRHGGNSWGRCGDNAFRDCSSLERVVLTETTAFGNYCFYGCTSLTDLEYDRLNEIGDFCFTYSALAEFDLNDLAARDTKDGTASIRCGQGAFMNCALLSAVALHPDMTVIKNSMFSGCTSLTRVDVPASVTEIRETAFYSCSALEELDLKEGVKTIGKHAFAECTALSSIKIPDSVTDLDRTAFGYWEEGQKIYLASADLLPDGAWNTEAEIIFADR